MCEYTPVDSPAHKHKAIQLPAPGSPITEKTGQSKKQTNPE